MPFPGHLSFPWAIVVFVHPDHPFHLVPVDLETWGVLVPHIPICFYDFDGIMVTLDLMVVVNHLPHHHLHHHLHHHYFLHFSLGEVVYHLLHSHHHSHYHLHYHQVEEPLLHLLVAEVSFYPFLRVVVHFLHPHHLVVVVDLHHPQQAGYILCHFVILILAQFQFLLLVVVESHPLQEQLWSLFFWVLISTLIMAY